MRIIQIRIHGKVQGVHFREGTKGVADLLKIRGWIRNEEDGTVFLEVHGEEPALDSFKEWCHEGTDRAKVEKVEWVELELEAGKHTHNLPYINFQILR